MKTQTLKKPLLLIAITIVSFYCFTKTLYHNIDIIPHDLFLFLQHNENFQKTGQLYLNGTIDQETQFITPRKNYNLIITNLHELYRPLRSVYKFPPAGIIPLHASTLLLPDLYRKQSHDKWPIQTLMVWNFIDDSLRHTDFLNHHFFISHTILNYTVFILCCIILVHATTNKSLSAKNILLLYCLIISIHGFSRHLILQNYELLIFACLTALTLLAKNNKMNICAILIGIIGAVKIYPLVLAIIFLKKPLSVVITIASFILTTIIGALYVGKEQSLFFFKDILPILLTENIRENFIYENNSLAYMLFRFFRNFFYIVISPNSFQYIIYIASISMTFFILLKTKIKTHQQRLLAISLAICTMTLCTKNLWSPYLMALFIPVVVIFNTCQSANCSKLAIRLCQLSALALCLAPMEWHEIAAAPKDAWLLLPNNPFYEISMRFRELLQESTTLNILLTLIAELSHYLIAITPVILWSLCYYFLAKNPFERTTTS